MIADNSIPIKDTFFTVAEQVIIEAPPSKVKQILLDFKNMHNWNPVLAKELIVRGDITKFGSEKIELDMSLLNEAGNKESGIMMNYTGFLFISNQGEVVLCNDYIFAWGSTIAIGS
jgi:hypothetical protein